MSEVRVVTAGGAVSVLQSKYVERLRGQLKGLLLQPGDDAYDSARTVWNGMVDKRPALIARSRETADVVTCVNFAREHELLVSLRGGGHNYAGMAVCQGGLMIDLSPMKAIQSIP